MESMPVSVLMTVSSSNAWPSSSGRDSTMTVLAFSKISSLRVISPLSLPVGRPNA